MKFGLLNIIVKIIRISFFGRISFFVIYIYFFVNCLEFIVCGEEYSEWIVVLEFVVIDVFD